MVPFSVTHCILRHMYTYQFSQIYIQIQSIWVLILDATFCISHSNNTLRKGKINLSPARFWWIVGQTVLFNFGITSRIEERKLWIQINSTLLKNWLCVASYLLWRGWVNALMKVGGTCSVMVNIIRNGHGDLWSNPGWYCLHFTYPWQRYESK